MKLLCVESSRFDVNQALNHDLLKEKLSCPSLDDSEDDFFEDGDHVSLPSSNIVEFNRFFIVLKLLFIILI